MKRSLTVIVCMAALASAFVLGRAQAEEEAKQDPMAAWMELGKPGPEHAAMKEMVGQWNCAVKSWHGPGEPTVEKGTSTFSMDLNGLMLKQDYSGTMSGIPFTGIGYTAFNKATKKYEALWMDSMSSGIMFLDGEKGDNDVITYRGRFFGPGGVKVPCRYELTPVKDGKQVFTMWMDMGAGEQKSMEMTYSRAE
jgi:hypothetical protein